jgi:hypothetical protein
MDPMLDPTKAKREKLEEERNRAVLEQDRAAREKPPEVRPMCCNY